MLFKLLGLFVLVPLVELYLLLLVGRAIGALYTVMLVVLTGILGGYLARREGLSVLRKIRAKLQASGIPESELLDGAIILVAGALLITPGMATDLLGLLGLFPLTREFLKRLVTGRLKRSLSRGTIDVKLKVEDR